MGIIDCFGHCGVPEPTYNLAHIVGAQQIIVWLTNSCAIEWIHAWTKMIHKGSSACSEARKCVGW